MVKEEVFVDFFYLFFSDESTFDVCVKVKIHSVDIWGTFSSKEVLRRSFSIKMRPCPIIWMTFDIFLVKNFLVNGLMMLWRRKALSSFATTLSWPNSMRLFMESPFTGIRCPCLWWNSDLQKICYRIKSIFFITDRDIIKRVWEKNSVLAWYQPKHERFTNCKLQSNELNKNHKHYKTWNVSFPSKAKFVAVSLIYFL